MSKPCEELCAKVKWKKKRRKKLSPHFIITQYRFLTYMYIALKVLPIPPKMITSVILGHDVIFSHFYFFKSNIFMNVCSLITFMLYFINILSRDVKFPIVKIYLCTSHLHWFPEGTLIWFLKKDYNDYNFSKKFIKIYSVKSENSLQILIINMKYVYSSICSIKMLSFKDIHCILYFKVISKKIRIVSA